MEKTTTYSKKTFSNTFDWMKMMGIGSKKAEFRIKTSAHWDELFPYEYIPPSSTPHFFPKKEHLITFLFEKKYKGGLYIKK